MRTPAVYVADDLRQWPTSTTFNDIEWVCARPMSYPGFNLLHRLCTAWRVFTGEYDALRWGANQ